MSTLNTVGNLLIAYCALMATAYPILYAARSNPRVSTVGRSLFWFVITIALVLDFATITILLGAANPNPPQWRLVARIFVYLPIAYVLTRQLVVLWRVQHDPEQVRLNDAARALARLKARARKEKR